ncbi:MAG TPA: MerR family DNA-binding transcriptional regulator [Tepidisphaeraceae bacterium]|nr:MerR family DNA-binding transcriptional regulator [Tepidisphaeraceae bacterium]
MGIFDGSAIKAEPLAVNQTEAARLLRVTDRTLRNWEAKGLLVGQRVNGGVKLYPYEQVKQLVGIGGSKG